MRHEVVPLEDSLWHMFGVAFLTMLLGLCVSLMTLEIDADADLVGWDAVGHEESARMPTDIR